VKIITPIELCNGGKFRYIDLRLMLIRKENKIEVKDEGVINDLAQKGIISDEFKEKIYSIYDICQKKMDKGEENILVSTEK